MCHESPPVNLKVVGTRRHLACSSCFTKCPLFRIPCAGYDRDGVGCAGHNGGAMTSDHAVALSLASAAELPRVGLADRLRVDDPVVLELAESLLPRARAVRAEAGRRGIEVVAWNAPSFPAALLTLTDPPPALWYRGHLESLDGVVVAIVGSRAASVVAIETAAVLASGLASRGVTVISGLARGIDSAAHRGALETGRTAAVLGSGVDRVYRTNTSSWRPRLPRAGSYSANIRLACLRSSTTFRSATASSAHCRERSSSSRPASDPAP